MTIMDWKGEYEKLLRRMVEMVGEDDFDAVQVMALYKVAREIRLYIAWSAKAINELNRSNRTYKPNVRTKQRRGKPWS